MAQVNIENLTKLAQERNDEAAWQQLWRGVFSLPAWFAVSDVKRPDAPMVLVLRDQPTLAVFTDEAKARVFIAKGPAKGASSTIRLPLPQSLSFFHQLSSRGVTQVIFNISTEPGTRSFGYGLAGLVQLASVYGVRDPNAAPSAPPVATGDAELDRLVAAMAADPSEAKMGALFGYVFRLGQWHVLARGDGSGEGGSAKPAITMLNQQPVGLVFTSEGLAQAQASARNITAQRAGGEGQGAEAAPIAVRSMPVDEAIEFLGGTMGLRGVVFNDGSQPFFAPMNNLRPMLEHFRKPQQPPPAAG